MMGGVRLAVGLREGIRCTRIMGARRALQGIGEFR